MQNDLKMTYILDDFLLFGLLSDLKTIEGYIDAFKYGAPPHAGGGIGNVKMSYYDTISLVPMVTFF